ncbi:MAG: T9SS type A sorting domain-containing protein, partial [Bacteroidota bacterium]
VKMEAGKEYTVEFKAKDFNAQGYQFTLNFDRNAVEFVQVNPAVAGAENFGLTLLEKGVITTSWNGNAQPANGDVMFSLTFKALANADLSDVLNVNSRYTVAEAYNQAGELLNVSLAFNGRATAGTFELYQNTPNPFSTTTVIGFNLPEGATATLTISDVSGKVVKTLNRNFVKGYNEVKLERKELPATGILYYQLDTPTDSATKMMLLMD